MTVKAHRPVHELTRRLAEAEATIAALLSGQIDAIVDATSHTPVLLAKAQDALRESEARYRRIVETTNEGISVIDGAARVTFVNQRFAEMLGYAVDELIGTPLVRHVADPVEAALRAKRARDGVCIEQEVCYLRKDGSEIWALLRTMTIRDGAGAFVGTLGMVTDQSHQRAATKALRKSEEQYRQIVETTPDGIIKIDADAVIVFVNRRFVEMLGYEPETMVGTSVFDYMSATTRVSVESSLASRREGAKGTLDMAFRGRDGVDVSVNVTGSALVDDAGTYLGNLAVVRDVTEQKKLQSQLMVSDRMASVGTLAAGVAHEINNPLAAVIANLDYIAESFMGDNMQASDASFRKEVLEPLDDARDAAQRVRFIVRDLKIFSRSPADEPRGPIDVEAIMESSLRMAWNEIRHRARLVKHFEPLPDVEVNEGRLGQVFLNLIVNAAQALPEGRAEHNEIRVSTRVEAAHIIIEVADTGPGIPPEIIGRIFDAFFTTKAVGVGTGLGLAICHRIVTDMGGELTVASEVGKGTTFRVAIPIAAPRHHDVATPAEQPTATGRRGRILVVDDEDLVARSVKRILSKEHEVVVVVAGAEALARCARGEKFDLVLCDLMMPDMTGMDLHRELARVAPEQRMIFLTGGAFTDQARRFLAEPAKEHIEKPFDPADLRAIVRSQLH